MKWWKISKYDHSITEVEVVRETEKQLVYKSDCREYRAAKDSTYDIFFNDEKEAVLYAKTRLNDEFESLKRRLGEVYKKCFKFKEDYSERYPELFKLNERSF